MKPAKTRISAAGFVAVLCLSSLAPAEHFQPTPTFNRDVRPILAEACFQCHGPDEKARKADLRLDLGEEALRDRGGYAAIVPGKPAASELISRITDTDPEQRMPPAEAARKLTSDEIATIRRWIAAGAEYQRHWSFLPPVRPDLPEVDNVSWPRNGIDHFVLARLEREGLQPSEEAERTTLIRRVTLDLTGLPPTPEEIDAFLADNSPGAYEAVVERLLKSPRYGERMAQPWLDAARYADTNGYQSDGPRHMWRWRDWVIDAFNENMPFDQFTVEQLAGDLLPDPSLEQLIATGFNRNHRGNAEGGIIPEEFRVEYVVDRVETTSTVWLGLTLGCTRCHDHKYDPFAQTEFYRLFAYFNNLDEPGKVIRDDNSPPLIKAPTRAMQQRLAEFDSQIDSWKKRSREIESELAAAQNAWEQTLPADQPLDWTPDAELALRLEFDGPAAEGTHDEQAAPADQFRDGAPEYTEGPIGKAAVFDGRRYLEVAETPNFDSTDRFSYGAWVLSNGGGTVLADMDEDLASVGYDLRIVDGRVHADLVNRRLDDAIRVETRGRLQPETWHHLWVTYDGSKSAKGVTIYVDGEAAPTRTTSDTLSNPITNKKPLRIGNRGAGDRFRGRIDDVRIYAREVPADEARILSVADSIAAIAGLPRSERSAAQELKIRRYYLTHHASDRLSEPYRKLVQTRRARQKFAETIPTTMIMREMPEPRPAYVLERGEYDKPTERVKPGVPQALHPLPENARPDRLGLARWIVSRENPLTARVTVNRYWEMYFGAGLVKTTEDFGTQGEWPTHPGLLDWLALEFIDSGWDVKALQKLIVTSATYRQSSRTTPELIRRDPENRLLARGPRFRLPAEAIRDQALAIGGLLVERVGGPSVNPYQPPGLWAEVTTNSKYIPDEGESLYRRSLYTYWKRTVTPPTMTAFDASPREMCVVQRAVTNTPLQALALLNDVTFVEAARGMAGRILREGGASPADRLDYGFRLATARLPEHDERAVLLDGYHRYRAAFEKKPDSAAELIGVGESRPDPSLDEVELAAWTAVASVILNLDEVVTKE